MKAPRVNRVEEKVELADIKLETLIQHFRTRDGINESYYHGRFGSHLKDDFGPALSDLAARGLIVHSEEQCCYQPTLQGYELNNEIGLALIPE